MTSIVSIILMMTEIIALVGSAGWTIHNLTRGIHKTMIGAWNDEIFVLGGYSYPRQVIKLDVATDKIFDYGENKLNDTLFPSWFRCN